MKEKAEKRKVVRGPSAKSLKEIPELDFSKSTRRGRGLHARKIAKDGGYYVQADGEAASFVQTRQGRPNKDEPKATTQTKNVRLPPEVWEVMERAAEDRGLSLHAAMRRALLEWLRRTRRTSPRATRATSRTGTKQAKRSA
jgi:hypothetical protein